MAQAPTAAALPAQAIQFELVSPEEKLVSEPVFHAVIPGEEGELGVGPDHTSLVVALKAGVVRLYRQKGDEPWKIFITGGFADVTGKNCTILAEDAMNLSSIDVSVTEQEISDLTEDLARADNAVDKARVTRKLALAKAKLQAVTGRIVA